MGAKKDSYTRRITLDKLLLNLKGNLVKIPKNGWISEIRQLIGIRSEQLAKKVGITQSSMSRLEESEREGTISLNSLQKVADKLDCDLYYTLVPRDSMENFLMKNAKKKVKERQLAINTTMTLEEQSVDEKSELKTTVEASLLAQKLDRSIWDEF